MRARWSLLISGQQATIREILLRDKPAHMLELSPKGTVPVLQLSDGTILEESLDVMLWALKQNDPEGWLSPSVGNETAMLELITQNDDEFKYHLDRYKYANRYENADSETHRVEAEKFLSTLEHKLTQDRFLFGDARSLADIAIVPFIRQFANADKARFDTSPYDQLKRWLSNLLAGDDFSVVMTKYDVYQPESPKHAFPPA